MAWSRKSAMFASLAVALYLLGLVLRNQQLVTVAVVLLSFLTWAAFRTSHADVSSSGRRLDDLQNDEGIELQNILAMRKVSSSRIFEDGEVDVTLRLQNRSNTSKVLEVRDRVPEVMRIKKGANYVLMELGPQRETEISYTIETWKATARQDGKMMVNEFERDAVSDIILIVDSRKISETGPVSRNSLVYSTRAAASLSQHFLSRRDSVGLVIYGDEITSVDRDTGKKQLYVLLTKLAGAMAKGNTPMKIVTNRIMPHINRGSPIIILTPLEDDPTIVDAVRDLRSRNFDVTILSPSSLEFEFDARRLDRTGYEVLKTERDILMAELRGLGAFVMDWEPDMMLNTALSGARGF